MSEIKVEDVLQPKIEFINNACYRVNRKEEITYQNQTDKLMISYNDNEDEPCFEDEIGVEMTENGRFKTSIRVPHTFYSYIIGTKGGRRRQIEEQTKTTITIPNHKSKDNHIVITGASDRNVAQAKNRIEMIAFDLRNKHIITHFISIPLISEEIKTNFTKFKDLIMSGEPIEGVDTSIFQNVDKIHLTLGVLTLLDDDERKEAADILENCKKDIVQPLLKSEPPLTIRIKGLAYMNDDPSKVDVLYANVTIDNQNSPETLQKLSDNIAQYFVNKGILQEEREHVKLHATLINTRYRKESESDDSGSRSRDRKNRSKRIAFDARPILAKFGDYDFGTQELDSIHLSHCGTVDENGYYKPNHTISCVVQK